MVPFTLNIHKLGCQKRKRRIFNVTLPVVLLHMQAPSFMTTKIASETKEDTHQIRKSDLRKQKAKSPLYKVYRDFYFTSESCTAVMSFRLALLQLCSVSWAEAFTTQRWFTPSARPGRGYQSLNTSLPRTHQTVKFNLIPHFTVTVMLWWCGHWPYIQTLTKSWVAAESVKELKRRERRTELNKNRTENNGTQ